MFDIHRKGFDEKIPLISKLNANINLKNENIDLSNTQHELGTIFLQE